MTTYTGTEHFVSIDRAVDYYMPYEFPFEMTKTEGMKFFKPYRLHKHTPEFISWSNNVAYVRHLVDVKIREKAILIRRPDVKPGQRCYVNDEGRYVLSDN
jgi:hypothetical protein